MLRSLINKKILINFSSTVFPMFIGLIAVPFLIDHVGVERFGIISIAWMVIGYFGLLDMGLGRALTQRVAYRLGEKKTQNMKRMVVDSLVIVLVLSLVASLICFLFSGYVVENIFNVSEQYVSEAKAGIVWVALTIPFAIMSTALVGVLEGFQCFGRIAVVKAPLSLMMFLMPLAVSFYSSSLDDILLSLFFVRGLGCLLFGLFVYRVIIGYPGFESSREELKRLFQYGGWMTITNIASPVMEYFDRFYIASVLSTAVVAYYTTPVDFLVKVLLVPLAILAVMFPSFATKWSSSPDAAILDFKKSVLLVALLMTPFCIVVIVFAKPGLTLWIDGEFAENSYRIAQIIAAGIFFNAMAMVPYAFLQGIGSARLTAFCHLLELPVYAFSLFFLLGHFGLVGAAIAWAGRVIVDSALLYSISFLIMARARRS